MVEGKIANLKDVKLPDLPGMEEEGIEEIEEPEKPEEETPTEEKPKSGDMINYSKEVDYGVVDEDGNRIPCSSLAEAKILSLLLELKGSK
ncbi:hypothetical protein ES702_01237 [subsurface metagenome]